MFKQKKKNKGEQGRRKCPKQLLLPHTRLIIVQDTFKSQSLLPKFKIWRITTYQICKDSSGLTLCKKVFCKNMFYKGLLYYSETNSIIYWTKRNTTNAHNSVCWDRHPQRWKWHSDSHNYNYKKKIIKDSGKLGGTHYWLIKRLLLKAVNMCQSSWIWKKVCFSS